jgi:hypothetical protein
MHSGNMKSSESPVSILGLATATNPRRSPLFQWMAENHDLIATLVDGVAKVNWEPVRALATEQGIRSEQGAELSTKKMWRAWPKVRKAHLQRIHANAKLSAGNLAQQAPIPVIETLRAETPGGPVSPIPPGNAPTDQRSAPSTWLSRSLKANPGPVGSRTRDSPAYPNAVQVASTSRSFTPEPEQDVAGEQAELSPGEKSMDEAIRQMHERANRRTGYIK